MYTQVTDIQLHSSVKRNPRPWYRRFFDSKWNKEFRLNFEITKADPEAHTMNFILTSEDASPEELMRLIKEQKIVIGIPKAGIPTSFGADLRERLDALKRKERRGLIHRGRTWHPGEE